MKYHQATCNYLHCSHSFDSYSSHIYLKLAVPFENSFLTVLYSYTFEFNCLSSNHYTYQINDSIIMTFGTSSIVIYNFRRDIMSIEILEIYKQQFSGETRKTVQCTILKKDCSSENIFHTHSNFLAGKLIRR